MILQELKDHTRVAHRRIEAVVNLVRDDLSAPDYRRYLERLAGFYRPIEARLCELFEPPGSSEAGLLIGERLKGALLERDLRALGVSPAEIARLPSCADVPRLQTRAAAYGCLYVLEGSTLGAQILKRHVGRVLGLTPETGLAYFDCYHDGVGAMWRSFGAAASRECVGEQATAHACAAALETFEALERWLAA